MSEPLTALIASTEAALERHKQGLLGPTGVSALLMDTLHQLRGLDAARPSGEVDVERLTAAIQSQAVREFRFEDHTFPLTAEEALTKIANWQTHGPLDWRDAEGMVAVAQIALATLDAARPGEADVDYVHRCPSCGDKHLRLTPAEYAAALDGRREEGLDVNGVDCDCECHTDPDLDPAACDNCTGMSEGERAARQREGAG